MDKTDPIRSKYFKPLALANFWSDVAFYVAAVLSIAVVVIAKESHSAPYQYLQLAFLVLTVAGFALGLGSRLYWGPRAQSQRLDDFLSKGLDTHLTHERTEHYYNNEETEPYRRIGMQLLENSFFSKEIVREMCRNERVSVGFYVLAWLIAIANRNSPIDLVVAVSLVLFSEQLISRIFRLEWLRIQFENAHDALYRLFQADDRGKMFQAIVLNQLVKYENAKANGSITISSRIFERRNLALSAQWQEIKKTIPKK